MMNRRTFNLIDAVCREGLGNDSWGVVEDGNTTEWFGSKDDVQLQGMFLYVYVSGDGLDFSFLKAFEPDLILHGEDDCVIRLYELI